MKYLVILGRGISIHALLAESDRMSHQEKSRKKISIHALLAESDVSHIYKVSEVAISIHALLAESDRQRETSVIFAFNFYPRSPCGERPGPWPCGPARIKISIHALLAESDLQRSAD